MGRSCVAVILPARNEEHGIGAVIDEIKSAGLLNEPDIIVAEHGSTDNTVAVAKAKGARVISCPLPGKGIGVRHVLDQLDEHYAYVFMLDADYTYPATHIPEMLRKLHHGADAVAGMRKYYGPGAMSFTHYVWNKLAATWLSLLHGRIIPDALTGMWGFRVEAIPALKLCSTGFQLEVDIWSGALLAGLNIEIVPIHYRARQWGEVKAKVSDVMPILAHALKRRLKG